MKVKILVTFDIHTNTVKYEGHHLKAMGGDRRTNYVPPLSIKFQINVAKLPQDSRIRNRIEPTYGHQCTKNKTGI